MTDTNIFIFGSGGHAKVVIDCIQMTGEFIISYVIDDDEGTHGNSVMGCKVIGGRDKLSSEEMKVLHCIVAIGDNNDRKKVARWLLAHNYKLTSVVHPSSTVSDSAKVGDGSVIMPGCIVNANAIIGDNVIINTGSIIEHDCEIHDNAHIAPGAVLCGNVTIGEGTLIGAGTTITPGVTVGKYASIGAGSAVVIDIDDNQTAVGVPAKIR